MTYFSLLGHKCSVLFDIIEYLLFSVWVNLLIFIIVYHISKFVMNVGFF